MTLSFLAGCKNDEEGSTLTPTGNTVETMDDYEGGVHIFNATDTDKDMIKDGVCNYTVVYPSAVTGEEETAVSEFNAIFQMATDLKLPTQQDGGLTHTAAAKYISIGNTNLLKTSGIDADVSDLGRDGCRVVTKDNTVYIFGGSDGVIYGVYDFMAETFGYEYYYEDCIEIDKNVTNLKLKNYDIKDVPDLENRWKAWAKLSRIETAEEKIAPTRLRMPDERGINMMPIHEELGNSSSATGNTHNSMECLPPSEFKGLHPNWYSNKGGDQLCWSAGCKPSEFENGNIPAEFEAMAQAISSRVQASLQMYLPEKYPEYDSFMLGMEDNTRLCACSGCGAWKEKYGTESAPAVAMMNRVGEITDAWMELPENAAYKRDMNYLFLAYLTFEPAPVTYDSSQDQYVPIDDLVTPNDNVGVYLAMIKSFDYQLSINHEMNAGGKESIDAWTDISDHVYMWLYQVNYRCGFLPYDSFNFFNDGYKYVISEGVQGVVVQGMTKNTMGSHPVWGSLKSYLESKMMWNANLDVEELIDNWFNAMFKEGAPEMKQMFYEVRAWQAYVLDKYDMYMLRSMYTEMYEEKHWPLATLRNWMTLCDEAIAKVEKYKTSDPETYEAIKRHVELEWTSPAYLTLLIYSKDLSSEDKEAIVTRFAADMETLHITGTGEGDNAITDFLASIA